MRSRRCGVLLGPVHSGGKEYLEALVCGKPVLAGTGISTGIIFHRFDSGESIADLTEDYDLSPEQTEEAIRYELPFRQAA